MVNFERQYASAISDFVHANDTNNTDITRQSNRTGIDTLVRQHMFLQANDVQNQFPLLRGKKMYPYMGLKELLWMLGGRTDVKWLNDRGVTYWDEWVLDDGTIGKSYGYQFRNFNGVDQIKLIIDRLLHDTMSRRIILSLWNPVDLKDMSLEPCQYDFHFTCEPVIGENNKYIVYLHAHMRSTDSFIGLPYDIIFDSFFLSIICNYCTNCKDNKEGDNKEYIVGNVYMTCDNFHLYTNHIDAAKQYIENTNNNIDGIIDSNTHIVLNNNNNIWGDFDTYLNALIDDSDNKKRELLKVVKKSPDIYGPIKAEIAI